RSSELLQFNGCNRRQRQKLGIPRYGRSVPVCSPAATEESDHSPRRGLRRDKDDQGNCKVSEGARGHGLRVLHFERRGLSRDDLEQLQGESCSVTFRRLPASYPLYSPRQHRACTDCGFTAAMARDILALGDYRSVLASRTTISHVIGPSTFRGSF